MTNLEARRRQQERALVRAIIREWAAEEGIPCPRHGRIPAGVMDAWNADAPHLEFGISVDGRQPVEDDLFDSYGDALEAVGDTGRERLMIRTTTPWLEVPR